MSRLPALRPAEILRALKRAGFVVHHIRGSHHYLRHKTRPGRQVSIFWHAHELPPGTVRKIAQAAGLSEAEFLSLL